MFCDFNKIFKKENWDEVCLTDQNPCRNCEEHMKSVDNPYYQTDKCNKCVKHAVWIIKVVEKLKYLEEKQKK